MIPRVGLRCRRIRTLCSEATGQAVTKTFIRSHILDKDMVEDVQRRDRELINHETKRLTHPLTCKVVPVPRQTLCSVRCFNVPGTTVTRPRLVPPRRDARYSRGRHCVVRVHHRPARLDRGLPASPYPP